MLQIEYSRSVLIGDGLAGCDDGFQHIFIRKPVTELSKVRTGNATFTFDLVTGQTQRCGEHGLPFFKIAVDESAVNHGYGIFQLPVPARTFRTDSTDGEVGTGEGDDLVTGEFIIISELVLRGIGECVLSCLVDEAYETVASFVTEGFVVPLKILLTQLRRPSCFGLCQYVGIPGLLLGRHFGKHTCDIDAILRVAQDQV